MNRRAFIQGLIGLASMPALSKFVNVFKPSAIREGITRAADNTMQQGIEFYEAVIKRVMDEGTVIGESDRVRTYKHPDKPDINVDLNVGTGDTAVYFETDMGSRAGAEITSDLEVPQAGKELMEHEEVYKMGQGDDYYKDIDEEITGGIGSLEEWIKRKRGYAAGGRVGMWDGGSLDYFDLIGDDLSEDEWEGILRALGVLEYKKGGRVGRWMGGPLSAGKGTLRQMLRHMSKGSSHGKSGGEMLKMVNPKQFSRHLEDPNLLFMKGSNKEGLMATDMVKDMVRKVEGERAMMIDELLSAAKNIRKADKSLEQYKLEMIKAMMAKGADRKMAENLAEMVSRMAVGAAGKKATPNITDTGLLELETIHKNLLTKGRPLNAAGGRVGMWRGGGIKIGKNVMNLLRNNKKIREAIDNIFPTGDYKYDAEMAVESLVELNPQVFGGKLADDLDDALRSEIYGAVITPIMQDHALLAQMKRASKPIKTLEGIENTGTINISDPNVAEEFTRFMKETDPKGHRKIEEIVELSNFDPKGRKKNAKGGKVDDAEVNLTVIKIPDISGSGVETLFERR